MKVRGTVKTWSDEEGWGVLTSPEVPGDVFAHFSSISGSGYRSLIPGGAVSFDYGNAVPGGQDGCPFVADNVVQLDS